MTALAPSARPAVLIDSVLPRSLALDIVLVMAGAALVTVLAQVSIRLEPVPITGQTLAVLLVGATLGAARGASSLVLYAVLGAAGLPVFAPEDDGSHQAGLNVLQGATGGYIIGFVVSAALVGWLSQRAWDRKILKAIVTFVAGSVVVFAFGLPWLAHVEGADLAQTLEWGLHPFIIGGAIKATIAAGLLPLAWWGADRLAEKRADESTPAG